MLNEAVEMLTTPSARHIPVQHVPMEAVHLPILDIARRGEGRLHLKLSGALPDDWLLRLARGCASRRIGVMSGFAARKHAWQSFLEFDISLCTGPVPDFLDLATRSGTTPEIVEPGLLEVSVSEARGPGEIEVEVHAWDAVGLLAAVLARADRAGWAPCRVVLETEEDCAFHRMTLETRSELCPTRRQRRELEIELLAMLGGPG